MRGTITKSPLHENVKSAWTGRGARAAPRARAPRHAARARAARHWLRRRLHRLSPRAGPGAPPSSTGTPSSPPLRSPPPPTPPRLHETPAPAVTTVPTAGRHRVAAASATAANFIAANCRSFSVAAAAVSILTSASGCAAPALVVEPAARQRSSTRHSRRLAPRPRGCCVQRWWPASTTTTTWESNFSRRFAVTRIPRRSTKSKYWVGVIGCVQVAKQAKTLILA